MLKIVIRNLISNAIKFTNFGGEIKINSILTKQGVEIIITDDGIGFNPKNINRKKGIGMKNIESRVALLEGNFTINTAENKGFKISIVI